MTNNILPEKFPNFVIFKTADGKVNIDVYFQDDTLWLTQKLIAELFGKGRSTITEHLKNIFAEGELDEELVCRKFRHTTQHGAIEGKTQEKEVLRQHLVQGYSLHQQRFEHNVILFLNLLNSFNYEYIVESCRYLFAGRGRGLAYTLLDLTPWQRKILCC
jgi:hypothetical protein